ncbi:MAG: hypothetical protein FJ138_03100 [Deltaproteobacteria bacterium]|nr:hypothetical protein [Deltaproteobacteria bacterium]
MTHKQLKTILITPECLQDLIKHKQYKTNYDKVIHQLATNAPQCARHAVRGVSDNFTVFESTVTGDLRLCWSYGQHMGESVIQLWALDGHDRVFKRLARLTGERFKCLQLTIEESALAAPPSPIIVGDPSFEWRGVRPPTFLTLKHNDVRDEWVSEHLVLSEEQTMESLRDLKSAPLLLSGGGGSGKTTLLINLLLKQLEAGERPILVTYHKRLADYCKRLVGDSPLRARALSSIMTIDELIGDWLTRLGLTQHASYISQEEARGRFVRHLPEALREAAWAEFRGMWKGRVDVDAYTERQRRLEELQREQIVHSDLWRTAEGEDICIKDRSQLTTKQREQLAREEDWRAHPKRKPIQKNDPLEEQRKAFYLRDREQQRQRDALARQIEQERAALIKSKRDYVLAPQRYGKDVRFLDDQELIKGAVTAYEHQLEGCGGDRLNACLELLTRADQIQSAYTTLLIDEAQDFTQLELQLISLCVPDPRAWVVAGDENQIVNPSGFRWERVKEVIWWSGNRLKGLLSRQHGEGWASLDALRDLKPIYLSVNFRNPRRVQLLARRILQLKQRGAWAPGEGDEEQGAQALTGPQGGQSRWRAARTVELEAPSEAREERQGESAEDHPWTWQPQSVRVSDEQELLSHIVMLSKSVPSFCLISFSAAERDELVASLLALPQAKALEIDFERVLTPLEVKGLEFDLVLALTPPLPTSRVEGIRDFEFNQIYVSATRARTSLAYVWTGSREDAEDTFLSALAPCSAPLSVADDDSGERIARVTWERHIKMSHLHSAQEEQDWSRTAARYAAEGRPKLAAELYRLGGFFRESAELLEGLEDYAGAIRDYAKAGLPLDVARCEAKRAERAGDLVAAHEAWARYGQGSGELEGAWRTVEGGMPQKSGARWLASLLAPRLAARAITPDSLSQERPLSGALAALSGEDRERGLRGSPDLWALLNDEERKGYSERRDPHQKLSQLRKSPHLRDISSIARDDALRVERMRPAVNVRGEAPPSLSLSDTEFVLGATSYYESHHPKLRPLELNPFQAPWSYLPRRLSNLFELQEFSGLDRYSSLKLSNRLMNEMQLNQHQFQHTRKAIVSSYRAAIAAWGDDVKVSQAPEQRGLLAVYGKLSEDGERDLSPKRLVWRDWDPHVERAYSYSGRRARLVEPSEKHTYRPHESWELLGGEWRQGIQDLIFLMGQLRLSHTPTRVSAAQAFSEAWLHITFELAGHWVERPAREALVFLEDDVLEQLSACSMSELRSFLTAWEEAAWRRVTAEPLPKESAAAISAVQAGALTHLMGLWAMAQALFLRGTFVGFINEHLKRAESLTGFGYSLIRAAHSHWVGLTLLPLYTLMGAMERYEEQRVTQKIRDEVGVAKERWQQIFDARRADELRLKGLTRQRADLRAELKRLQKHGAAEGAQGQEEERDRARVEEAMRDISAEEQRCAQRLAQSAAPLEEATRAQRAAEVVLVSAEAPMRHIREQRDFFEWAMRRADAINRSGRRLSDDDFKAVSATWRSGREWTKLIFDIGEGELRVFLPLLNRYREARQMRPFRASDLHFHDGARRTGVARSGGESPWRKVMPGLKLSSPLAAFEREARREGELPSAGALLSFAIEQGYTPLSLELFEDEYYPLRASARLMELGAWGPYSREREELKGELEVLRATPKGERTPWLSVALELTHERPLGLFLFQDHEWSVWCLREVQKRQRDLPELLARGAQEALLLWAHLSDAQRTSARACLYELERLWPCPLTEAAVCVLMQHRPERLEVLYAGGALADAHAALRAPHGRARHGAEVARGGVTGLCARPSSPPRRRVRRVRFIFMLISC